MLLPHVTTSDSPAASDSSAVTPYNSSAILSDWPTFLREDGVHPSASGDGAGGAGGGAGTGAPADPPRPPPPAGLPAPRSITVVSTLYPFPSLETVPWRRRGNFDSFACSSGALPPAGRRTTSAPASAIKPEASRRGRTETVPPISSFARDARGAMAMRREEYTAADAGREDITRQERRRTAPRTARPKRRTGKGRTVRNLAEGGAGVNINR